MLIRCLIAYALNMFDYGMTKYFVNKYGIEIEGSPIGRFMLSRPPLALIVKSFVVLFFISFLYDNRDRLAARIGSWIILVAYSLLAIYHIVLYIIVKTR